MSRRLIRHLRAKLRQVPLASGAAEVTRSTPSGTSDKRETTVRGATQLTAQQAATPRGRPHLGPRVVVTATFWPSLERLVDQTRACLDRSPFLADLLAWHVDRPDLIRHHQLILTLRVGTDVRALTRPSTATRHCTVRVHPAVAGELVARAQDAGLPARCTTLVPSPRSSVGVPYPISDSGGLPLAM